MSVDRVKLIVGGRIMETERATLTYWPSSTLARMVKDGRGKYWLNYDPDIFAVILNWLRHGKVLCTTTRTQDWEEAVHVVAEELGITPLVETLCQD